MEITITEHTSRSYARALSTVYKNGLIRENSFIIVVFLVVGISTGEGRVWRKGSHISTKSRANLAVRWV